MSTDPIYVPPPNVGPEPPGLLESIKQKVFGAPAPAAPDPYTVTPEQAVQLLQDTKGYCEPGRELFEYAWWRNLLYLLGRQWIYWNPSARSWNDKRLARWVPKPVTNIIRTAVLSIRATFAEIRLTSMAQPNGNSPINLLTAQTADDMEPIIQREHNIQKLFVSADFWAIITGNVWLHPHWDANDPTHTATKTMEQCQMCQQQFTPEQIVQAGQKCPGCGAINALQSVGDTQEIIGRGRTIVASPLELMLPIYAQNDEQVDRLIYMTWRPKHDLEAELGANPKTQSILNSITWDTGPKQRSLQLYKALATTSDLSLTPSQWDTAGNIGTVSGAVEQHLWIKPNGKYPNGFYMRFIGDASPIPVMDRDVPDLPYKTVKGKPLWPWIHYQFEEISGRLYGSAAIDSIIQKQDQINQIDSMTQMVAQRMGNPVWLEPKGAEVERFTGEPGLIVRWQPVGANAAKPERIGGENPPQSFFTMREQYKTDAEELAGTYDVLKGAKPAGVEAFSALQLLVDRSQSRFKTPFDSRLDAYRQWYQMALELERNYGPDSRINPVLGPNKSWTFQTFKRADLDGDITISTDTNNNQPKTALGRRAAIEHAKQLQLISPDNSEQTYQIFMEIGLPELMPSLDSDVKSALQEQQAFEEWFTAGGLQSLMAPPPPPMGAMGTMGAGAPGSMGMRAMGPMSPMAPPTPPPTPSPLIRMPWHNDRLHLQENRKWMNSDAVRNMLQTTQGTPLQAVLIQLLAAHLQAHAQALVAAAAPQGAPGTAPTIGAANASPAPGGTSPAPVPPGAGGALASSNAQGAAPNQPPH